MKQLLPAEDIVSAGLKDLQLHRETIPALLVSIAAPKLRSLGLRVPETLFSNPEHRLYDLLSAVEPDTAHSKYNALIRRLVSFQRAIPCVKNKRRASFEITPKAFANFSPRLERSDNLGIDHKNSH